MIIIIYMYMIKKLFQNINEIIIRSKKVILEHYYLQICNVIITMCYCVFIYIRCRIKSINQFLIISNQ